MEITIDSWTVSIPDYVIWRIYQAPEKNELLIQLENLNIARIQIDNGIISAFADDPAIIVIDTATKAITVTQRPSY